MDKELRTNAKSLSPEEQFQLRRSIIRLSKAGKKIKEVAEILDVSKSHIKSIRIKYKKEGLQELWWKRCMDEQSSLWLKISGLPNGEINKLRGAKRRSNLFTSAKPIQKSDH